MADLETIHRVVEKIEVAGSEAVESAFDKMAAKLGAVGKGLGLWKGQAKGVESVSDKLGDATKGAGDKAQQAGEKGEAGGKATAKAFAIGTLAAKGLEKAIGFVVGQLRDMKDRAIEVALEQERMQKATASFLYGATASKKGEDPGVRMQRSMKVAGAALDEFRDIGIKTATPVRALEGAYRKVGVPLTALKKSQWEVLKFTRASAATAKVYGRDVGEVADVAADFIKTGQVNRADPFGFKLWKESGVGFFSTAQTRAAKVQAALERMGAPVGAITRGVEDTSTRWQLLVDDVLSRTVFPMYERIRDGAASIVDWTDRHRDTLKELGADLGDAAAVVWDTAAGAFSLLKSISDATLATEGFGYEFRALWDIGKAFFELIDAVGQSFKVIEESVNYLVDPSKGMDRMNVALDSMYVKLLKVVKLFGGWMKYIPGLEDDFALMDRFITGWEKEVAEKEAKLGIKPTTDIGKEKARKEQGIGLSKDERAGLLKSVFGNKRPLINIESVTIQQDFRQTDPDAVAIEMVRTFEKLSEAATQSTVGGNATALGVGGAF